MKIGVLSDTHIPVSAQDMPREVYEGLKGVDMILHAGDLVDISVLERLNKIAPTKAVCGNMDNIQACEQLQKKEIIDADGVKIGLVHGWGPPAGILKAVKSEFSRSKVDVIVFGHSHNPICQRQDGILLFNPGSSTDQVYAPYTSYGILEIKNGEVEGRIIRL